MSEVTNPPTPASGRGKQLDKRQEEALIRISKELQGTCEFRAHPKAFWLQVSENLLRETGRVYSWQSCQRRMTAWESPFLRAPYIHREKPSYRPREEVEDIEMETTHSLAVIEGASSPPVHEESDNDLPHTPLVLKRSMNAPAHPHQPGIVDLRCDIINLVQCTMLSLETQVNCLANTLVTDKNSCEGITDALNQLKGEVTKAIGDYKRSA